MRSIFDKRDRRGVRPVLTREALPTLPDKYDERATTRTAPTQPNGKAFKAVFSK